MSFKKIKDTIDYYNGLILIILTIIGLGLTFYSTFYSPRQQIIQENNTVLRSDGDSISLYQQIITNLIKNEKLILYVIASILFIISAFLFVKLKRKKKLKFAVFAEEGRFFRSIKDLMADELFKNEIHIASIKFTDITTIKDLVYMCTKVFYPNRNQASIESALEDARKKAYSIKYSFPRNDDEKLIGREEFGDWEQYFFALIESLSIVNFYDLVILDVGIGNANTYSNRFLNIKNFIGIDLSATSLLYAKKKFNNLKIIENEAEHLKDIENSSIDIYLSFRTFQSTLFDRKNALLEARRILKPGGIVIISLPILYFTKKDKFIKGLSDPSKNISIEYAFVIANSIKKYLEMLNFNNASISDKSPYELFIYGQLEE